MINGERFFLNYCAAGITEKLVLDVGSYDVNGTLGPVFRDAQYVGMDMTEGPGVDVVGVASEIPFPDAHFDVVVSTSCFEHDDMFWVSFLEMLRVLKPGGVMYINAPSNGPYHGWPGDNWRFYADSWKALEKWGRRNGVDVELVESYISGPEANAQEWFAWEDSVGIYRKLG